VRSCNFAILTEVFPIRDLSNMNAGTSKHAANLRLDDGEYSGYYMYIMCPCDVDHVCYLCVWGRKWLKLDD
jgi:hypothetical protein